MNPRYFRPGSHPMQSARLNMSASLFLRQSLRILEMPLAELLPELDGMILENPLLEWEWDGRLPLPAAGSNLIEEVPDKPSLFEHLGIQAKQTFSDPKLLEIAEWIIGNLEPTGFFLLGIDSTPFPVKEQDWDFCLKAVKEFDPPGIAARDLRESFLLQLEALGKRHLPIFEMVSSDFEALAEKKILFLRKKYGLDEEAFRKCVLSLRSLTPFPGHAFRSPTASPLYVDAVVSEEATGGEITLTELPLPREKTVDTSSLTPEEKLLCNKFRSEARIIVEAVKKRNKTLQRVCSYLVDQQKDFLFFRSDAPMPLTVAAVAAKLGLHDSTVSRSVAGKNLLCPRGVIPLKSLLCRGLSGTVSSEQAKKLLQKIIEEESRELPLSDRELLEKIQKLGVPCSRRTLTNYRKRLNIPSKRLRKPIL